MLRARVKRESNLLIALQLERLIRRAICENDDGERIEMSVGQNAMIIDG